MTDKKFPEYAAQLAAIHATAFAPGWSDNDFAEHMGLVSDDIIDIVVDGKVQGFALTRTARDQAEILTIVVAPAHQRKGLGQALLQLAEDRVRKRGADIMFLDVAVDNQAAIHLYENNGYHQCGRRPGYYRRETDGIIGRVDAVLYKKHLA
jgi:[ribosomal protein S18]-alanine N-acetyltransferase